jgi:hypothetical protein
LRSFPQLGQVNGIDTRSSRPGRANQTFGLYGMV